MRPGLIGIVAQDTARFTQFYVSLAGLEAPEGSARQWVVGHDIPANHNVLVHTVLEQDLSWLFILGDDHAFEAGLLMQLLSHDTDIVVPLCLTRMPPYTPVAFTGSVGGARRILRPSDFGDRLVPIESAGTAGMLVSRQVLETLDDPWFEYGRPNTTQINEDVYFCDKARAAGFSLYCDMEATMGHSVTGTVWPRRTDGVWHRLLEMSGGTILSLPADGSL